jgi:predicted HD superfamily hydrolase involved in NAD metabolism
MNLEKIQSRLSAQLTPKRFEHSLGVMDLAVKLAPIYQIPPEPPRIAGLLHDVARELPAQELLSLAHDFQIPVLEIEEQIPVLLHGKVGVEILKREWGILDPDILQAISLHVTGAPEMSILSQIIFIADFAEPGRGLIFSDIAKKLAFVDRCSALSYIFDQQIMYILNSGCLLHPNTIEARNKLIMTGSLS